MLFDLSQTFVFVLSNFSLSRYAEEVVGCFRFIVLYVLGMTTFTITLCGILMIMVRECSGILCIV